MSKNKADKSVVKDTIFNIELPSDFEETATELVKNTFDAVSKGMKRLAQDIDDFDKRFEETQKKIDKGAKKTNGLII